MEVLDKALGTTTHRNYIAHCLFVESKNNDGADFFAARAQGKVKFPEMDWSVSRFERECEKIYLYYEQIRNMRDAIKTTNQENAKRLAVAILALSRPMPIQRAPNISIRELLQLGEDHTPATNPATPEIDGETLLEPPA